MEQTDKDQIIEALTQENRNLKKKIVVIEKGRKRTERFFLQNQEVLSQVNNQLADALLKLEKAQVELIHQEKMAGLGQLIAGISHEINTPAGAIVNSIKEIHKDYATMLDSLAAVIRDLPGELVPRFINSARLVTNVKSELGTIEERNISKEIGLLLKEEQIESATNFNRNLATIGFTKNNLFELIPLLKSEFRDEIYNSLFMLGMNALHIRDIQIGTQRIISLVKALKLYSHSVEGDLVYTKLSEDVETTLIILHNRLKHGINVIREFDAIPEVRCDSDQLNQVWTNLINNAIEAMKGKGQLIIRLKQNTEKDVRVEIEDNGPGIPTQILDKIFEPYFTTKPKGEGTGLGLSISKSIIDKHKGTISVDSQTGKTVFKVILPLDCPDFKK